MIANLTKASIANLIKKRIEWNLSLHKAMSIFTLVTNFSRLTYISGLKWHFQLLIVNYIYELSAFTLLLVYLIKKIARNLKIAFFCVDIENEKDRPFYYDDKDNKNLFLRRRFNNCNNLIVCWSIIF